MSEAVDFDVGGIVGVRLLDATERDAATVERQLGPLRTQLERAPDIVIHFVDRLEPVRPLVCVGAEDAAFSDGEFVLMRGRYHTRLRAVVPFDRVGAELEITCEHDVAELPLLVQLVNAAALAHGVLPIHASAFVHDGAGVVVTGWSGGGKTDALLGFAARGARYVGDDWVYLAEDGRRVTGLPEPVRLWERHLRGLPAYRRAVPMRDRARLRLMHVARAVASLLPAADGLRTRARSLLGRHLGVEIAPARLFGADAVVPECSFDVLFLAVAHGSSAITVEPVDPLEVAVRESFSLLYESADLRDAYAEFRFAFPWRASIVLERADEIERRLLRRMLAGKRAYLVRHPVNVRPDALADAMAPYCRVGA